MSFFRKRKAVKEQARKDAEAAAEAARKIAGLRAFVETLIDPDESLPQARSAELDKYFDEHKIEPEDVPADLSRTIILASANAGNLVARQTLLLLRQGEVAYIDQPAFLLKEVVRREFQAGSQGISVPLGSGIRYRIGAVRGQAVTIGTEVQTADTGVLTVTNQRVVYHGGRRTLEFAFPKLVALTAYSDAIALGVTKRQSTSSFRVEDPPFLAGMIRAAFIAASS